MKTKIALVVFVALLSALYFAPASWLNRFIPNDLPIVLSNTQGSIWQGQAAISLQLEESITLPGELTWQFHWNSGKPQLALQHPFFADSATYITWHNNKLSLSKQQIQLPAQLIASIKPELASFKPQGELTLSWPTFDLFNLSQTPFELRWSKAALSVSPVKPLGDYRLLLEQDAEQHWQFNLQTLAGPLFINGAGHFQNNQHWQFNGEAYSSSSQQQALSPLLNGLGPMKNQRAQIHFEN